MGVFLWERYPCNGGVERLQGNLAQKKHHEQVSDAYIEQMLVGLQAWVEASNANSLVPPSSPLLSSLELSDTNIYEH